MSTEVAQTAVLERRKLALHVYITCMYVLSACVQYIPRAYNYMRHWMFCICYSDPARRSVYHWFMLGKWTRNSDDHRFERRMWQFFGNLRVLCRWAETTPPFPPQRSIRGERKYAGMGGLLLRRGFSQYLGMVRSNPGDSHTSSDVYYLGSDEHYKS